MAYDYYEYSTGETEDGYYDLINVSTRAGHVRISVWKDGVQAGIYLPADAVVELIEDLQRRLNDVNPLRSE